MKARFYTPTSTPIAVWLRRAGMAAVLGLIPLPSNAQSVSTVPVGAMTYTFPATTQVTTTYISIPLTNPAVYTLPVASLTPNTLTFSGTPFPAGGLAQTGSPFFARIATGAQAGRTVLITANTTSAITVDSTDNSSQTTGLDTSGWAVAAGDRIEIIVGDTLASLFGKNTVSAPLLLVGGSSPLSADTIGVYNKNTGGIDNYYFNINSGYWRPLTINSNSNNVILYPELGINVTQRSNRSAVSLTITGEVPAVYPLTKVTGGTTTIYTGSRYPVDFILGSVVFSNWNKSNSPLSADTINIYNSNTGKFDSYFQRLDNSQWNKIGSGLVDQSSVVISGRQSFSIIKRGAISDAASFIYNPLPYTL